MNTVTVSKGSREKPSKKSTNPYPKASPVEKIYQVKPDEAELSPAKRTQAKPSKAEPHIAKRSEAKLNEVKSKHD